MGVLNFDIISVQPIEKITTLLLVNLCYKEKWVTQADTLPLFSKELMVFGRSYLTIVVK